MSSLSPVLTAAQETVLAHIANGATHTAAAASAGVHRNTVHNWQSSPAFCQALAQAQYENACFWHDQTKALAKTAMETLRALLTNPDTRDSVRLKAALAILDRVSQTPSYDDVPAPPQIHRNLHKLAQADAEPKPDPEPAIGEDPLPMHNPAQAESKLTPGPRPRWPAATQSRAQRPVSLRQRQKVQAVLPRQVIARRRSGLQRLIHARRNPAIVRPAHHNCAFRQHKPIEKKFNSVRLSLFSYGLVRRGRPGKIRLASFVAFRSFKTLSPHATPVNDNTFL